MTKVSIVDLIAKKMKRCIAIVEDGDTASQSIASGKFVIWKGNPYKASTSISSGDTLSTSNLTALSDGIGNELNSNIATTNSKISNTCYADHDSKLNYTIPLTDFSSGAYWLALMYIQTGASSYGLYIIFMNTSDVVTITPLVNGGGRTFTGARSGNNIVLTANDTVWGGIRVLMMN